jgi:hypothetical protein
MVVGEAQCYHCMEYRKAYGLEVEVIVVEVASMKVEGEMVQVVRSDANKHSHSSIFIYFSFTIFSSSSTTSYDLYLERVRFWLYHSPV